MIGIDPDKRLFYEGSSNYGHGLWPSPTLTVASIVNKETVYRDDCLSGLRTISRNKDDAAYVRMVSRVQDFSRRLDFGHYDRALRQLEVASAFERPGEAKLVMSPEPAGGVA